MNIYVLMLASKTLGTKVKFVHDFFSFLLGVIVQIFY